MSGFQLGDDSRSASSDEDDEDNLSTLPFATPLRRSDFLVPDFSPSEYLSTLRNRHQTLEDLRAELRSRSQLLSKELLDLVNSNYQDFLNLGNSLHGGEEKVEEVRVGLLGFRKEVDGLMEVVGSREEEVKELLDERRDVRRKIEQAKSAGSSGSGRVIKVMKIYTDMEESAEAVKLLKTLNSSTG
ncbi:COG2 multi-domain protein [Pyrenophora tritici-repentis]|nr:COG2 multi-domain protein [Pyrenophora tritici-repentis]KAI1590403.1 COG2 multi-domain protein [Pyrenophora tritici-repentis]